MSMPTSPHSGKLHAPVGSSLRSYAVTAACCAHYQHVKPCAWIIPASHLHHISACNQHTDALLASSKPLCLPPCTPSIPLSAIQPSPQRNPFSPTPHRPPCTCTSSRGASAQPTQTEATQPSASWSSTRCPCTKTGWCSCQCPPGRMHQSLSRSLRRGYRA